MWGNMGGGVGGDQGKRGQYAQKTISKAIETLGSEKNQVLIRGGISLATGSADGSSCS